MYQLFLLVVTLAVAVQSSPARRAEHDEYVVVREVYDHVTKRSDVALPDVLRVEFEREGKTVRLDLQRNKRVSINVPVTFVGGAKKEMIPDLSDVAVYQDVKREAVISIRASPDVGHHKRKLEGSFGLGTRRYMISPVRDSLANMMGRLLRRNMVSSAEGVLHHVSRIEESQGKTKYSLDGHADFDGKTRPLHVRVGGRKLKLKVRQMEKRNHAGQIASYHVEILFVLDHTVWEYWMKKVGYNENNAILSIKYFYSNIMNGIDLAYKTIDSVANGIMITPWLKGYHIAKTYSQSPWTTRSISSKNTTYRATAIDGNNVISELSKWVTEDGRSWANPDHAMLWTKYNLFGDSTIGYAPVGTICNYGGGISVNEDRGFHSWATAAHELGHNLGAAHDVTPNGCDPTANIMSSIAGTVGADRIGNRFHFSSCSIKYFKDLLSGAKDGYPRVCLINQVCSHGAPLQGIDKLPGVEFSTDAQCRLKNGESSYYCGYDSDKINICHIMYCQQPLLDDCYGGSPGAADGTPCASNKWCHQGLCVSKQANPDPANQVDRNTTCTGTGLSTTVPAGCVDYNMEIRINRVPYNCAELALHYPSICFTWDGAVHYCCAACHKAGLVTPQQHYLSRRVLK